MSETRSTGQEFVAISREKDPLPLSETIAARAETMPHRVALVVLNTIKHLANGMDTAAAKDFLQRHITSIETEEADIPHPPPAYPSLDLNNPTVLAALIEDGKRISDGERRLSQTTLETYPELSGIYKVASAEKSTEHEKLLDQYEALYDEIMNVFLLKDSSYRIEVMEQSHSKLNEKFSALKPTDTLKHMSTEHIQTEITKVQEVLTELKRIFPD
ncbi:MAG: hypothetical protein COU33_02725 [Candidatus Magasanikbacteria bacterium CG10_big_fil_rev_8_21_14_0_10_43_6]|uniref:Uncharacterized protein n=1 Tax=Candidatus Magasanikbacteria bacterium CG10_big_fil_rev_8_21_14_0_10_43_6 TaxID=1974650 RepID=A0A2M6W140_9BACT|nr:MAG: hypothetical protein COU33_02725 [Candidatus Magasanikbacteria bacterium CG10_big_fil_rev_8_21_14_0_10_43_6]